MCVEFSSSLNPLSEQPTFTAMAKQSGKAKAGSPKFCLLRWLEDKTVSVVPATTAEAKQKVYVGAIVNFKWLKQMYEAEVLKISSVENSMLFVHILIKKIWAFVNGGRITLP